MSLLEVSDLTVRYGGLVAVNGVHLAVEPGELVGLIGPNGAGKTTLIDALTGFTRSSGQVVFQGRHLDGEPPHVRAGAGLARTWQSIELFHDLTVEENLRVSAESLTWREVLLDVVHPRRNQVDVGALEEGLASLGLGSILHRYPSELSQGERKLVGVCRALVGRPALLCLDEPAAGLDNHESEELGGRLRGIVNQGTSMILVDHDMQLVRRVCDRIIVVEFGKVIASGEPEQVMTNPEVLRAYLGVPAA
jgi:branched-chain amino acid transport system ATP-binding protein